MIVSLFFFVFVLVVAIVVAIVPPVAIVVALFFFNVDAWMRLTQRGNGLVGDVPAVAEVDRGQVGPKIATGPVMELLRVSPIGFFVLLGLLH